MKLLTKFKKRITQIEIRHEIRFKLSYETVNIRQLFQKYVSLTKFEKINISIYINLLKKSKY